MLATVYFQCLERSEKRDKILVYRKISIAKMYTYKLNLAIRKVENENHVFIHSWPEAHIMKITAWHLSAVGRKYDGHNPGTAHLYPSKLWHKFEKVMLYPGAALKKCFCS